MKKARLEILLLLLGFSLFITSLLPSFSDSGSENQKKIHSLVMNKTPVGRAISEVAQQGNIKVIMDKPAGDGPISLNLIDVTPKEALEALFKEAKLRYDFVSDDMVVVTDAPPLQALEAKAESIDGLSGSTKLLKGKVEHSQSLSPVDSSLRAGAQYDLTRLKALSANNLWYRIPAWSAGSWHKETCTTVHRRKFKSDANYYSVVLARYGLGPREKMDDWETNTYTARSDETWGFQKDRNGEIWQFAYNNYQTLTEGERSYAVSLVKDVEVIDISDSKVVLKFVSTKLLIDKYSRQIGIARQTESIQTYTTAGGNLRRVVSSVRSFDEDGQPEAESKVISLQLRTKAFDPWNVYEGRDMRALFAEYLVSHGMKDLVPVSLNQNKGSGKAGNSK